MGVWHNPYWEERATRWQDDMTPVKPSGSGSISTCSIDEDEAKEAAKKRIPLGFVPPAPAPTAEPWGEADWTARDIR